MAILPLLAALAACTDHPPATGAPETDANSPPPTPAAQVRGPLVVFLGDSLTAGNGLAQSEAYPAVIQDRLAKQGRLLRIVNAGVSGDTSAGGLARLPWLLAQHPDVVVVALGANDGLRGLPADEMERNLTQIVVKSREAGAKVLLVGMHIPPNYGEDYARAFGAVFPKVAEVNAIAFVPFLLEGVGGNPGLNQADGIHPTAAGQEKMADTVWQGLSGLIDAN